MGARRSVRRFERQYTTGGANLMVVRADGTKLHALTTAMSSKIWNCHPSWSGNNLVFFTSNRDGNFDLYVTPATGKGLLQLDVLAQLHADRVR